MNALISISIKNLYPKVNIVSKKMFSFIYYNKISIQVISVKKHSHISLRQMLFGIGFLLVFSGMTILLFSYKRDEKRFANITTELFTEEMKANTLSMHYTLANPEDFGIYDYKPVLSGYTPDSGLNSQARTENMLAALKALHTEKLSETDAWLWRLLTRSLENSMALSGFSYYSEPFSPVSGMQTQLPILLAEYTFRTKRDVEDYLALLSQTEAYFSSLLLYEQEKAEAGLGMPAAFLKEVREQCDSIITSADLESGSHFLQLTFRERLDSLVQNQVITSEEADSYNMQNERLLKTVLLPAYIALGDGLLLLEDDSILPTGLASYPDGKAYYEQLLIAETGSYRTVKEIQDLLTARFAEDYETLQSLMTGHPEILQSLGEDMSGDFPYGDAVQMLVDLQQRMTGVFPPLPEGVTNAAVKSVSSSLEPYCAPAFYLTAPLDATDANTIYINHRKTPGGLDLYTTLAHEGYPGHLYQTVYHNRSSLASGERPARQLLWYGGYQEGWALYVEFLSYEYAVSFLREDGQDTASLIAQLESCNRSIQLCLYSLIDTMIHYDGASYSQIATVLESFGITDSEAIKSVYNYIVQEPCNYLKYYLGYLEILSLQETAKELWGEEYTDYRFHCFYLDCGPADFLSLTERLAQ